MLDCLPFAEKFIGGQLDGLNCQFVVHVEALDDSHLTTARRHWEREDKTLWDAVLAAVREDARRLPLAAAVYPVSHVVDRGIAGRCGRGCTSEVNDLSASLLDAWRELLDLPVVIDEVES